MTTESLDNPSQKLHICLILLFGILFVFSALNDGLVSDDFELIEKAQFVHPYDLLTFFSEPGHKGFYRPLPRLLLSFNWSIHGIAPFGYHLLNGLIHLIMCLYVYKLVCRLTENSKLGLSTSILFAVHFIHVEPVFWVSARNELLVSLIYLVIIIRIMDKKKRFNVLTYVLFILGLLCKETAVTIPVVIFLWGFYSTEGLINARFWHGIRTSKPFWSILMGYALLRWSIGAAWPWNSMEIGFGIGPFLIIKNIGQYTLQLLMPIRSIFDLIGPDTYEFVTQVVKNESLISGGMIFVLFLVAICVVDLSFILVKFADRNLKIGLIFALLTALPYLLMEGTGLRYMYLPSVGFLFAFTSGIQDLHERRNLWRWASHTRFIVPLTIVISLWATWDQTRWWDQAGQKVDLILDQVKNRNIGQPNSLYVFNIPRRIHGAYLFHNGFEAAIRLNMIHHNVSIHDGDRALEDTELIPEGADRLYLKLIP